MEIEMKVEVVSRETIRPSSPTPQHFRTFNISFLDQIAPPIYIPLVLFYTKDGNDDGNSNSRRDVIKKSLSESLTRFYPLAGRIKDEGSVDCNDDGVDYLEAKVTNSRLSQVIQQPDVHVLQKFLPCEPYSSDQSAPNSKVLLAIQVNVFEDCGGMVIGICILHRLADASSLSTFINDWAATARGATEQIKAPCFELPTLFPKVDLMGFIPPGGIKENYRKIVTKRFVFEASKITELKKQCGKLTNTNNTNCGSDNIQEYPTRVEALSAFIWKRFVELDQAKGGATESARVYSLTHAVNLRKKTVPPLPTDAFGNMYSTTFAVLVNAEGKNDNPYPNLVGKVREATARIDDFHVRKLQSTEAYFNFYKKQMENVVSSGQATKVMLHFSSWCRFSIYEADFGWGKPTWATTAPLPFQNVVVFMDTRSGDGIEAWVNMTKEDMAEFECDKELCSVIS